MKRMSNHLLRPLALLLATAQILLPLSASAGISQLPPLVKPNVPPNVFYTLDDSGSMMFEVLPETLTPYGDGRDLANGGVSGKTWTTTDISNYCSSGSACAVRFAFPPPANVYSPSGGYTGRNGATVVGFSDVITVARWRSAYTNKAYYDPAIRYDPWVDTTKIDSNNPYGLPMPAANIAAAKFNPIAPTGGSNSSSINLTVNNTTTAYWLNDAATSSSSSSLTFYPATYYVFVPRTPALGTSPACTGANVLASNLNCFTRIEIRSSTSAYTRASTRTDCKTNGVTCTYQEEIQNFANWFQYYRSRILMARGGSAAAFANQPGNLRVGFGTINTSGTVINRISDDFSNANKISFIDTLYKTPINTNGTPLIKAVDEVGKYFMDGLSPHTGNKSPWQTKYGVGLVSEQAACRQSFNILMTDGYWNGNPSANYPGDWDGKVAPTITGPDGKSYTYSPVKPYADAANGDTLADIAFYYWSRDLRPLDNIVPTSKDGKDIAFWQHLVQFTVGLGVDGVLNSKTDLPALTSGAKVWPDPDTNDRHKVDDLWHAAVNSRGKYFNAGNPTEFADALKQALNEIAARSGDAAAIATSNTTLGAGVKLYTATYRTGDWSGRLEQKSIFYNTSNPTDPANGSVSQTNDWDTDTLKPDFGSRKIVTSAASGTGGLDFSYSNLFAAEKSIFDTAAATYGTGSEISGNDIINYIKGDTGKEGDFFRRRTYWLGDLVNSDPQYVKEGRDDGYSFLPTGSYGKTVYQTYLNNKKNRAPTVYVGSNDGMLHAFDASGASGAPGTGGTERFAFIPKAVIGNLPELAKPNYVHRFYVDGTPNIADAPLGSNPTDPWRTILVGTTGAGAKSVFALDVTDPTSFTKDSVKWEISAAGDNDLGYTIGVPQVGRLKDGRWVTIFGNGFSSINGAAVLYVADLNSGNVLYRISTGVGNSGSPNGLSTPKLLIGPDATILSAYAGDIQGNLWKFDFKTVTGITTPSLAFGSTKPLFTATDAVDGSGRKQPITTQPQIYQHPMNGYMIIFGTGKIFEDNDSTTVDNETLYGVWDQAAPTQVSKSLLVQQKLSTYGTSFYQVTKNAVDWVTKRGWYLTLDKKAGERLVTDPNVFEDQAIFTTLIPGISTELCANDGLSATIQISALNGAALGYQTIDTNGDGVINSSDVAVSGRLSSSTLGTTVIRTGNRNLKLYQAASKDGALVNTSGTPSRGSKLIPTVRLWRQLVGRQ